MVTHHIAKHIERPSLARCQHAPGAASPETCLYLHALERIRRWTEQAEREYLDGEGQRTQIGELWVLNAELAYALDNCPNGSQLGDAVLLRGTRHPLGTTNMPPS